MDDQQQWGPIVNIDREIGAIVAATPDWPEPATQSSPKGSCAQEATRDRYLAWIASHPSGYVINIRRGHNPSDARLHLAACDWIRGENQRGGTWTGQYVKVCAHELDELEEWALEHVGRPIRRCGTCQPARDLSKHRRQPQPAVTPRRLDGTGELLDGRTDIRGPDRDRPVVEVWADDYVHFENRPAWLDELRAEILNRVGELVATEKELLHATFFGPLPARADVENLLLYNVAGALLPAPAYGSRWALRGEILEVAPRSSARSPGS